MDSITALINVIERIFPKKDGIEFEKALINGECKYKVHWLLKNDPLRLKKRSKYIIVILTKEAIDDYDKCSSIREKKRARDRLRIYIEQEYHNFDPEPSKHTKEPGIVRWRVHSDILFPSPTFINHFK